MHIHIYPYRYINAHTNTHTHTHHIHVNIHTYTLYTCIHIQWNELLMHLCDEDIIHRHTSLENLNEHIFSFLKTHPNQTTIHMTLTAPSKKTPYLHTFMSITNWVITPTYWVINFWFRGFSRLFGITCGAAFLKYLPFVILLNLPTAIQPNFIFLTIGTYMISYRPPNIYTQSSHPPSVCPSMSYLWMDIIYQPLDRYLGPDLV